MNITLSADKSLIEKSRKYAKKHNTSINNLIRNYLNKLVSSTNAQQAASEFETNVKSYAGKSGKNFKFSRSDIYQRGLK